MAVALLFPQLMSLQLWLNSDWSDWSFAFARCFRVEAFGPCRLESLELLFYCVSTFCPGFAYQFVYVYVFHVKCSYNHLCNDIGRYIEIYIDRPTLGSQKLQWTVLSSSWAWRRLLELNSGTRDCTDGCKNVCLLSKAAPKTMYINRQWCYTLLTLLYTGYTGHIQRLKDHMLHIQPVPQGFAVSEYLFKLDPLNSFV